jgi:hypothetical protein
VEKRKKGAGEVDEGERDGVGGRVGIIIAGGGKRRGGRRLAGQRRNEGQENRKERGKY